MTTDHGRDAARQAVRRQTVLLLALVLVTFVGGSAALGFVDRMHHRHPPPALSLGLPLVFVTLVFVEVFLVLRSRQRRTGSSWGKPALVLAADRVTRRRVRAAVRRGELPPGEPDRHLALDLAERLLEQRRWVVVVYFSTTVLYLVNVVLERHATGRLLFAVLLVLNVALVVLWFRMRRGARRVLAQAH